MNIGTPELILIVVLAIILYGKRLPEITRALGKGYQEFKKNVDDVKNDFQKQVEDSYPPDRLGRAGSTSKTDPLPLTGQGSVKESREGRGETQESSPVRDKYYAGALSEDTAKENNSTNPDARHRRAGVPCLPTDRSEQEPGTGKLIPVTRSETNSKNQDKNLAG